MAEQYTENQYDDDLTVEAGEYDEYYPTDAVDLFEFSPQEESPLTKLKSLILSIDWEITDDILMQFNDELVDLQDIWAAEKFNLVYLQALEKISKYIYQQKANAHPDAIKLLLTFYYNLEKIVYSEDLTEHQKKDILLKDVKRFAYLKRQIANQGQDDHMFRDEERYKDSADDPISGDELLGLKAIVLGIDWEITDHDLNGLREEVIRLEEEYAESRPRLILLQGIGILGAYIKVKKANAHGDAFKLLHQFFDSLEKIVKTSMSREEEKEILFPMVEKFNSFKALVGPTLTPDTIQQEDKHDDFEPSSEEPKEIQPAFADIPVEGSEGFQEDVEARDLGYEDSIDVSSHIDDFFGNDDQGQADKVGEATSAAETETNELEETESADSALALEGADVGYDEEDEVEQPDEAATISMDLEDFGMGIPGGSVDTEPEIEAVSPGEDLDTIFSVDKEVALQGVDVETEADDDSDEEALPVGESGKLAPALGGHEEISEYGGDSFIDPSSEESLDEELSATLDDFFVDEQATLISPVELKGDLEEQLQVVEEEQMAVEEAGGKEFEIDSLEEELSADEETVEDPDEVIEDGDQDQVTVEDQIGALGVHIDSITLELDDKIIQGLYSEIDQLNHQWEEKPLEKSFLQLLSTVTQHIDQYRPEPNSESFGLLKSNYDALGVLGQDVAENQELFFKEMSKVLQWQQNMVVGQELPVEAEDDSDDTAEKDAAESTQESEYAGEDDIYSDTVSSNVDLQKEIAGLRETLQLEIAALKKELKR